MRTSKARSEHSSPKRDNRRQYRRTSSLFSGTLVVDSRVIKCLVMNLSLGGAQVRADQTVPVGTSVTLTISRFGVLRGKVVRAADKLLGIDFDDDAEMIAELVGEALPSDEAVDP